MSARITMFLVSGPDYFAALLDNGWARVGLIDCAMYDFPPGHAMHARVLAARTHQQAEDLHDEHVGAILRVRAA